MYYFCTYFDQHYLAKGLALYHSLKQHCPAFRLWVLCLDEACYQALFKLALPEVELISLERFEEEDTPLQIAKQNRSRVEYYFTCTPSLPLFILNHHAEVNLITYVDADLFFFSDPAPIYDEMEGYSIGITAHNFFVSMESNLGNFLNLSIIRRITSLPVIRVLMSLKPPSLLELEKTGMYNVGWLSFRRDANGLACLQWWRERCIEWCYDRFENNLYADQKYLDQWPKQFPGVVVLQHKGANLAPWNLNNYLISLDKSRVLVDNQLLVFYHFQGFRSITNWLYRSGFRPYNTKPSKVTLEHIYLPYIYALLAIGTPTSEIRSFIPKSRLRHYARQLWILLLDILKREYIFCMNRRIIR